MLCLELGKSEAASLATMAVCDGGRAPGDYTFRDLDARPGVHARAKRPGGVGPRAPTGARAFWAGRLELKPARFHDFVLWPWLDDENAVACAEIERPVGGACG